MAESQNRNIDNHHSVSCAEERRSRPTNLRLRSAQRIRHRHRHRHRLASSGAASKQARRNGTGAGFQLFVGGLVTRFTNAPSSQAVCTWEASPEDPHRARHPPGGHYHRFCYCRHAPRLDVGKRKAESLRLLLLLDFWGQLVGNSHVGRPSRFPLHNKTRCQVARCYRQ